MRSMVPVLSSNAKSSFFQNIYIFWAYSLINTPFVPGISKQSSQCTLSVTPTSQTFRIWGSIYTQTAPLYLPFVLNGTERFHLDEVNIQGGAWYKAFVADKDNTRSVHSLERMSYHLQMLRTSLCSRTIKSASCCAVVQYQSWVRIATLLSIGILTTYGNDCNDRIAAGAERQVVELFQRGI